MCLRARLNSGSKNWDGCSIQVTASLENYLHATSDGRFGTTVAVRLTWEKSKGSTRLNIFRFRWCTRGSQKEIEAGKGRRKQCKIIRAYRQKQNAKLLVLRELWYVLCVVRLQRVRIIHYTLSRHGRLSERWKYDRRLKVGADTWTVILDRNAMRSKYNYDL
jgi:hypothetical protein